MSDVDEWLRLAKSVGPVTTAWQCAHELAGEVLRLREELRLEWAKVDAWHERGKVLEAQLAERKGKS